MFRDYGTCTSNTHMQNNNDGFTLEKLMEAKQKIDDSFKDTLLHYPTIYPSNILPPDFTLVQMPPKSKHRSKRVWKKLAKKIINTRCNGYSNVWIIMGKAYAHPTVINKIKKGMK